MEAREERIVRREAPALRSGEPQNAKVQELSGSALTLRPRNK